MKCKSARWTVAAVIAAAATGAWAGTDATWIVDANGNWTTPTNWDTNPVVPGAVGDTVTFGDAATTTQRIITLDANETVSGITVNNTTWTDPDTRFFHVGYKLQLNNQLTLSSGGPGPVTIDIPTASKTGLQITGGVGKFNVTGDVILQLSGKNDQANFQSLSFGGANVIGGTGTIIKRGGNALTFDGAPAASFSGTLRIEEGALNLNGGGANALLAAGGTLQLTNGTATRGVTLSGDNTPGLFTAANAIVFDQTFNTRDFQLFAVAKQTDFTYSGNWSSTVGGVAGALTNNIRLTTGTGQNYAPVITISGDNSGLSFAEGYGINGNYAQIVVAGDNALGAGNSARVFFADSNNYSRFNTVLASVPTTIASPISAVNPTNGSNKNPVTVFGSQIASGTVNFTGTMTLNDIPTWFNGAPSNPGIPSNVINAYQFQAAGTSTVNFNGEIGNGSVNGAAAWVIKTGTGTAAFNAPNTYLGRTAVRTGTLLAGNANALGDNANTTAIMLGDTTTKLADVKVAVSNSLTRFTWTAGTITGAPTLVDGVTLAVGDRVLVANNNTTSGGQPQVNGIYVVQSSGTWVRADDMNSNVPAGIYGYQVHVTDGTQHGGQNFYQISALPFTVNTTVNAWAPDTLNPEAALLVSQPMTLARNIDVVANASTATSTLGSTSTTGAVTFSGIVTLAKDLTITAATSDVSFTNKITGGFNVTKSGGGKIILANAGTMDYSGSTTITQGILEVDTALASSQVIVNSGATLQGIGNIAHGVTIDGDLSPGNSIGTLTVGSALFGAAGKFNIELGSAGVSDLLTVIGNLDIANASLDLTDLGGAFDGSTYVIAGYGSLTGEQFFTVDPLLAANGYVVDYNYQGGNQIALVVPEPATLGLLAAGGLMIAFRGRR